ncbi:histone-lysine N-methyltransferase SETDB1-like, partial [Callorhinchus milii]|uniref:histone-lysine N-methyltransferase SETDB1-like n=1 Tax=Callorhinchus milii TaxID=7868 RepID=UPI001C3FC21A
DNIEEAMAGLGLSMEELGEWIDQELDKVDFLTPHKAALSELESLVEKKEAEVARIDGLFEDASRSVAECELLVKDLYCNLGLEYEDAGQDAAGPKGAEEPSEVIEILDDEDDDVMAIEPGIARSPEAQRRHLRDRRGAKALL